MHTTINGDTRSWLKATSTVKLMAEKTQLESDCSTRELNSRLEHCSFLIVEGSVLYLNRGVIMF